MKRKILLAALVVFVCAIALSAWHEKSTAEKHLAHVTNTAPAEKPDREELFRLALAAEKGLGRNKDIKEAEQLYLQAAAQHLLPAEYALGRLYESGNTGKKNMDAAFHWYSLAAERGHMVAQYHLGLMYFRGDGVPKDPVKAWLWFSTANQKPVMQTTEAVTTVWRSMTEAEQKAALAAWPAWKADYVRPADNSSWQ